MALADEIASTLWYHSIELAPGVVTPGWFDLRPIVDRMPWPDVRGKRCLDIGTYDGFLAFELERRGASEVVAVDIDDHAKWDWPPDVRTTGAENLARLAGEKGRGFEIAAAALGSRVERVAMTVYELRPEAIGMFDVVVCGSLLLHLRDPLRALEAIRSVCAGRLLSAEQINLPLSVMLPRYPVAHLNGSGEKCRWWVPNSEGHRRMVFAAGFEVERATRPYTIPYGASHPRAPNAYQKARSLTQRIVANGPGVPHSAVLATPRV